MSCKFVPNLEILCRKKGRSHVVFCAAVVFSLMIPVRQPVRADDWSPLWSTATLSQPRALLAATAIDGKVFFAGGAPDSGHGSNVVDIYDSTTGTWSTATLSQGRIGLGAASANGRAVFAGGWANNDGYSNTVDIYDTTTDTWSTATLSTAREYVAGASVGDRVLFGGGSGSSSVVDIYDTATNSWSTASLSDGRSDLAATSADGKVFFGGGDRGYPHPRDTVDIYDSATDSWSTASLSSPRESLAAASANGKVLFAGGGRSSSTGSDRSTVDIYDIASDTWSQTSLSMPRQHLAGTSVGSRVLFAGGSHATATVDIYDTETGVWTTDALSVGRNYLTAASTGNRAFFAGGQAQSGHMSDVVDIYTLQDYDTIESSEPWTLADQTTVAGRMQLNAGAGLDLDGYDLTIGSMGGVAPIDLSTQTLVVGGDDTDCVYSGLIQGAGTLIKTGGGTLELTAVSPCTGQITVADGRLVVTGSLAATGSLLVGDGGSLEGNGALGPVVVSPGGQISPGNTPRSCDTLTLNGDLSLARGASIHFDLAAAGINDLVSMSSSTLLLDGQGFSDFGFSPNPGFGIGTYTLIDAETIKGGLSSEVEGIIGGLHARISLDGSDLVLTVVPEPSCLVPMLVIGVAGLLTRSFTPKRRASALRASPTPYGKDGSTNRAP